jgi:predicted RNA-binding Zn ribbon-like protein
MIAFPFLANALWLDFVNTELSDGGERIELLGSFDDLSRWARDAQLIDDDQARAFASAGSPGQRDALLRDAHELRTELRKAAARLAHGDAPTAAVLERVNALLGEAPTTLAIKRSGKTWRLESRSAVSPRAMLARVAENFARYLVGADVALLRACASEQCRMFFHDTSKNHKRRWCSMEYCGNRAKVASHRARLGGG